jgi:hypothetical protein
LIPEDAEQDQVRATFGSAADLAAQEKSEVMVRFE